VLTDIAGVLAAGVAGLLIGSFLNVVIWRVPRGESVVRPGSRCPGCEAPIAARDNVPVLSWVVLRGRARCCGEPISPRYPLVEVVTALSFGAVAAWTGLSWVLPALLYFAAISVALTLIDLEHHRLPDAIVLPSYPVAAGLLALASIATGDYERLVRAGVAGVVLFAFYFLLLMIYPSGMGFGDVKLAGVLGLYLGWFGWSQVVVGAFLGFFLGGVIGITLMLAGRANRKSMIPFGPFMVAGAWIGLVAGEPAVRWYLQGAGL
jgi:leader peptidase (prepilin peptidase) / N-methyltransferase